MDQQELKETIRAFLNSHRKAILGCVTPDNKPRTSLLLYVIDDDLNFYFGTRKQFSRYENLCNNPNVSIAVAQGENDPLQVVEARGTSEFVPEEQTKEILTFFESKNPSDYYVKGADDFVMFKIKPESIRWLDATSGELQITDLEL